MDVLFLTSEIPFPPHGGGAIKSLAVLEHLRGEHRVHLACFTRRPLTPQQERWVAELDHADTVPLNRGRTPFNLVRSYIHGIPLSAERNRSPRMTALVSDRLREARHDVLFVDGWLMAQYVPRRFDRLKLLHQHNAEHVMWRRQVALERNAVRRAVLRAEYRRVRAYEASILPTFDTVFAVSEPDRRALVALGADPARVRPMPNVADPDLLSRPPLTPESSGQVLLFLGTLSWEPNVVGLELFLRGALPRLREQVAGARLVIAGQGTPPRRLIRLIAQTDGAQLLGPVADPEEVYRTSRIFVDPSRGGAGGRVKVLNAMARGLPVVATPDAAEGLQAVDGEHLLVADAPSAMAEAIRDLLSDDQRWLSLSRAGRDLVRRHHVPDRAFVALDEVLTSAAGGAGTE